MAEVKWREVYGSIVGAAFRSLRDGAQGISAAKSAVIRLLTEEAQDGGLKPWQSFIIRSADGAVLIDTTDTPNLSFRQFIEAAPLRGLGESIADIERLLSDEPEALARLREELAGCPGGANNPDGLNQYKVNANNISNDQTDLFDPPAPKPKRKTEHGTRKDYTLARLKKAAPALFDEVKAGRLSANAAALQAGIRRPMKSVPIDTPQNAVKALLKVFEIEDLVRAIGEIADRRTVR